MFSTRKLTISPDTQTILHLLGKIPNDKYMQVFNNYMRVGDVNTNT